jgi:hypothetical protein
MLTNMETNQERMDANLEAQHEGMKTKMDSQLEKWRLLWMYSKEG